MSRGQPIPKERLTAYERWEMASFDPPPPPPPPPPPAPAEPVPDPWIAERARLIEETRAAAYAEGAAAGHAEGYQAGFSAGHLDGLNKGLSDAQAVATHFKAVADAFTTALAAADAEVADGIVALAFDVAREVVRQSITLDPTVLLGAVREVLATEPALVGAPQIVVNPADMPVLEAYLKEELEANGWTLHADPAIERGGCRARAATGDIDATLTTRWKRVLLALGHQSEW
ncbi:flagellar assembly protein FliH [Pararobbsia silviterrae]|uniref:Flagellar assembly protein FliH n=1 Tax=Pararobbsia silviterrae TaxID=1792498 RepID=A0A494X3S4_9BURK|nr:flagellar assembly protein FliH [Pararobbsia silviterrae]RKP45347.1 flagellar assembly protein FliH [Pararobbsia silviterrae]